MDPIQYALSNLRHKIPQPILELAFGPNPVTEHGQSWNFQTPANYNIDYSIYEKVLLSRVHPDINLFGAMQMIVDLTGLNFEQIDYHTKVYRIPYERTEGRRIVSVQSVHYKRHLQMYVGDDQMGSSLMSSAAEGVVSALGNIPVIQTANIQIIGDNVIMIRDHYQNYSEDLLLLALIEFDQALSNLNQGAYPVYAELVEWATKAYIYTHCSIPIDQGRLYAGMELGRIREIIEDYRDANEEYQRTLMERWRVTAFTNDRTRMHNYVRSMVRPGV